MCENPKRIHWNGIELKMFHFDRSIRTLERPSVRNQTGKQCTTISWCPRHQLENQEGRKKSAPKIINKIWIKGLIIL